VPFETPPTASHELKDGEIQQTLSVISANDEKKLVVTEISRDGFAMSLSTFSHRKHGKHRNSLRKKALN